MSTQASCGALTGGGPSCAPATPISPDQQTGTVRQPVVEVRAAAHTPPALTVIIEDLTLANSQVGLFYRVDRHGGRAARNPVLRSPRGLAAVRRKIYRYKNGQQLCQYLSPVVEDAHV
jgi:hypothetical protein